MTTGAEKTVIALKRLMAAEDFRERFLDYVNGQLKETRGRVWDIHGVIGESVGDQILPGGGFTPDHIQILQGGLGEYLMTDGIGNFISLGKTAEEDATLGQIKSVVFENLVATQYFVSLQSAYLPRNIQVNPRTGIPEYSRELEVVGDRADVDQVIDNGTNLTFVIDGVVREANHSHAGRTAVVFMKTPSRGATSDAIGIESLTVFWTGTQNRVTTSGLLGQVSPSLNAADYEVVLLGPSIAKRNTLLEEGHAHIGIITGTGPGGTPGLGSINSQRLFDKSLADAVIYNSGPAWYDGTPNPGPISYEAQLDKIVNDLTGATGGFNGAAKIQAAARANWADGTANLATGIHSALNKIITDLTSLSAGRGADKLTCAALPNWADATTLPAVRLFQMLEAIVNALAGSTGTQKIGGAAYTQGDASISAGTLRAQLIELVNQIDLKLSPGEAVQAAADNVFSGAFNIFNNLLRADTFLQVGEGNLSTGELAEEHRIRLSQATSGVATRTLLFYIPGATRNIRVYAANGNGISNEALEIVVNAFWDHTTGLWYRDGGGSDSYVFAIGRLRMAFAGSLAVSGSDGFGTGTFWSQVYWKVDNNADRADVAADDMNLIIGNHTGVALTTDSNRLNHLSARNICKAWGHFRLSAAGALTVTDVYNITSITFDDPANQFVVTLAGDIHQADYPIVFGYMGGSLKAVPRALSEAVGSFRIALLDTTGTSSGADLALPDGVEHEVGFLVFGDQDSA